MIRAKLPGDMSARERLAGLLYRSGALSAVHELRRLASVLQQVVILTYHHVADNPPGYPYDAEVADATPAQFRRQMELLARHRTPIGIDELRSEERRVGKECRSGSAPYP